MKYLFFFLSLLWNAVLIGCTSASQPVSSTSVLNVGGAVEVEIWASKDFIMPGEKVDLRATVTNRTGSTQVFELKGKPVLDIIVGFNKSLPNGELRWSDGKPLSNLTRLELKTGESKSIEMDLIVPQRLKVGTLSAEARYFYSAIPPDGLVRSGVTIYVGDCRVLGP